MEQRSSRFARMAGAMLLTIAAVPAVAAEPDDALANVAAVYPSDPREREPMPQHTALSVEPVLEESAMSEVAAIYPSDPRLPAEQPRGASSASAPPDAADDGFSDEAAIYPSDPRTDAADGPADARRPR